LSFKNICLLNFFLLEAKNEKKEEILVSKIVNYQLKNSYDFLLAILFD
jgi:hypothetical protein